MDFKILTPIVSVCALSAFVAIQLAYEYPSGLVYLFFEAESLAIFIVNLLYFIGSMLEEDMFPPSRVWIGFLSLVHALFYVSFAVALLINCSGETLEGMPPELFEDNYKIKVLVGLSFGIITSVILIAQFVIALKDTAAL